MALITCQECGKDVSDKAECCPNCGCPVIHSTIDDNARKKSNTVYCYKKGIQNLFLRCSYGCEFKYMNTLYKRTILENGDYKFVGGLPIICPLCKSIYNTISFTPVENISTNHIVRYKAEIINCIACGGKVSNKAKTCPHCGQPTNRCPICGSDDIVKINGFSKGVSLWGVGAFATNTVLNDFQCNKCNNKFK